VGKWGILFKNFRTANLMFYLVFAVYSLGAAMLQSSHIRAPKGVVPTRRRISYMVIALLATGIQILAGAIRFDPPLIGILLFVPIFYLVHRTVRKMSLRLRYTFRIGLALVLLSLYPLYRELKPILTQSQTPVGAPDTSNPEDTGQ